MNILNSLFNSNILIGLGVVAFVGAYVFKELRSGAGQVERKLYDTNKELIERLEDKVNLEKEQRQDCQTRLTVLEKDLAMLAGKMSSYKEVLENRSPVLEETLRELKESAKVSIQAKEFMDNFPQALKAAFNGTKVVADIKT